jgi:hypothetical protein
VTGVPLKHLCSLRPEYGLNITPARYRDEGVRLLRTSDIAAGGSVRASGGVFLDGADVPAELLLRDGDLLFSRSGTLGRALLYSRDQHGEATFAGFLVRIRLRTGIDPRAIRYWSESAQFVGTVASEAIQSTISNFNADRYANLSVPAWLVEHSAAIADYLDAETAQIDSLIRLRRQQAKLNTTRRLEAARAAFHGRGAPTRRLAWAPDVPAEWPVIHLRWLASCLDGKRIPVNREERATMQGDIPYWGANGVVDHVDAALFKEPLVLLGEDGAPFFDRERPKAFFVDAPVWVNNHIHVLRPHGIRPRFLAHYLNVVDYSDFVGGSTRDKLTQDDMGSIPVPVPPLVEQERIEQEISVIQRWADEFEAATERQVNLLTERRQALITGAVTGRLHISGVAA